jgi:hypothetical protein
MDTKVGSTCYNKVNEDKSSGILAHPEYYKNLNPQSSFKQFQLREWLVNKDASSCPMPCGPGSCDMLLRFDGCDTPASWHCNGDDGSLKYHCCCKAFPVDTTAAMTRAAPAPAGSPTLFCISLMIAGSYEVDLLRGQLSKGQLGIFGCDDWAVYSNESISLDPTNELGDSSKYKTSLMEGSLEAKRGGKYDTALNTPIFIRFWKVVMADPRSEAHEWIVKVDPDTMFMPDRLKLMIKSGPLENPEPATGMYLNNCFLGLHGPIEVFSQKALQTYKAMESKCTDGPAAEHGQEDWYLRACFEDIGVLKVDAFNILLEGYWACKERPSARNPFRPPCHQPQVAYHPFKSIDTMLNCWSQAVLHPVPNPFPMISTIPGPENEDFEY